MKFVVSCVLSSVKPMPPVAMPALFPNSPHCGSSSLVANLPVCVLVSKTACVVAPNFRQKKNASAAHWRNSTHRSCRLKPNSPPWVAMTSGTDSRRMNHSSNKLVACRQFSQNVGAVSIVFEVRQSIRVLLPRLRRKRLDWPRNFPRLKPRPKGSRRWLPNLQVPRNCSLLNVWHSKNSGPLVSPRLLVRQPKFVANSLPCVRHRVGLAKNEIASRLAQRRSPRRLRNYSPKQNLCAVN